MSRLIKYTSEELALMPFSFVVHVDSISQDDSELSEQFVSDY